MPQNSPVIACTRFLTISSRVGSAHLSSRPKKTVCGAPCANKGFCEYVVNQGFFGDLRCAPELISLHKTSFLPSCFPRFLGLRPSFLALRLLSPPQGYTSAENKNRFGSLHCALLLILLFEVLLFGFLMTQSPLTAPLLFLSDFFGLRHKHPLPCGVFFPPLQGHKPRPKEVDACLFNDQARQQSRNHSTSPYSQPSSTTSSRCSCVRSSSQQQPAATTSQRCCHSTKHQEAPPQAGSAGAQ